MQTISNYLEKDHHRCDALFAQMEASIVDENWEQAERVFQAFQQALEQHLSMEERILFPAFEKAIGTCNGPTHVMRAEHQQMRNLVSLMQGAVGKHRPGEFFDHDDTLRIIMGQHNLKEEAILYAMTDRVLSGQHEQIIEAMDGIAITTNG